MDTVNEKSAIKKDRQEKKKRIRQEQLIAAAENVFFSNGYDSTTLEMIADELGYTKRTLYLYFKDKDEIFFAVTARGLEALYDQLGKAVSGKKYGFMKLRSLTRAYFYFFIENPAFFEFNRIYETKNYYFYRGIDSEAGPFASKCQQINDRITELLFNILEEGIKDGSIRADITAHKLMLLLWGTAFGLLEGVISRMEHLKTIYGSDPSELFDLYVDLILNAVSGDPL
jgi:AcrR family transcriptional regulator